MKVPIKRASLKSNIPPAKSPLTPFTIPPKLKLPANGLHTDAIVRTPSSATPLADSRKGGSFPVPKPLKKVGDKEKHPAPKSAPKAQSSGMAVNDLRGCRNALKKLQTHKKASVFLQPVDPVRDRAPKYEIVDIRCCAVLMNVL